jgi:hypothetical protein
MEVDIAVAEQIMSAVKHNSIFCQPGPTLCTHGKVTVSHSPDYILMCLHNANIKVKEWYVRSSSRALGGVWEASARLFEQCLDFHQ